MLRLHSKTTYKYDGCSVYFNVLKLQYMNESYSKVRGLFVSKKGDYIDRPKTYKIKNEAFKHWQSLPYNSLGGGI